MVVDYDIPSAESGKFTLKKKNRSESGKMFTVRCRLPPKSTNLRHCLPAMLSHHLPSSASARPVRTSTLQRHLVRWPTDWTVNAICPGSRVPSHSVVVERMFHFAGLDLFP